LCAGYQSGLKLPFDVSGGVAHWAGSNRTSIVHI